MNSQQIMALLNVADSALRDNLRRHDLEAGARAHVERACAHVREACVATNEIGKARTVQQLTRDLDAVERLLEKVRHHPLPDVVSFKMRV